MVRNSLPETVAHTDTVSIERLKAEFLLKDFTTGDYLKKISASVIDMATSLDSGDQNTSETFNTTRRDLPLFRENFKPIRFAFS